MVRSTDDLPTSIGTFDARRTPVASIFHTAVQAFQFHFQLEPSPLGTHIVCDLFIKMTQAEGEAPDRSVSCCTVFCHVSLARVCLTWPQRTHLARRRTTAASCGRAPREMEPQTPDTRCPCATHDRYSFRTY